MTRTFRQLMGELGVCLRASRLPWNLFPCLFDGDDATTTKLQKEKVLIRCISSLSLSNIPFLPLPLLMSSNPPWMHLPPCYLLTRVHFC